MINWKDHKAGFAGRSVYFIKGVFRQIFTVTSVTPPTPIDSVVCFPGTLKDIRQNGILKDILFPGILVDIVFNGILVDLQIDGTLKDAQHNGILVDIQIDGLLRVDC